MQFILKKNKDKACKKMAIGFQIKINGEFPNTEIRKLLFEEIERYMFEP